jgi:hypothetical protein
MEFSLRFEGDDANFMVVNRDASIFRIDELPPSGLQDLVSGFRLVLQILKPCRAKNSFALYLQHA